MVSTIASLNARVTRELRRGAMEATDDDDNVRMDDEDCESESLSHSSEERDEDEEDDEEDADIIVPAEDEEEGEEDDEEEEEEVQVKAPVVKRVADASPSAAVKEIMKHVEAVKERGDTSWFVKSMEAVWNSFPLMKGMAAITCLGVVKEQPESAGNRSNISGMPATRWVCSPRRPGGSKVYTNFAANELELVQIFFLLASFTRPTWKAYKDATIRDLAETFNTAMHVVQEVEYTS